jgi:hypothetical protein
MQKLPKILEEVKKAGHAIFENGDYDINLIGVRNPDGVPNKYDDILYVVYKKNNLWQVESFQITTDPGLYFLENPINVLGTAILCPGQYKGVYRVDYHRGKYLALCQRKPVKCFRDNNRDKIIDMAPGTISTGRYGINLHRSHAEYEVKNINKYSAGCQTLRKAEDLDRVLYLVNMQFKEHPTWDKSITYTLLAPKKSVVSVKPKKKATKVKK